jgi:hypothetical protein
MEYRRKVGPQDSKLMPESEDDMVTPAAKEEPYAAS